MWTGGKAHPDDTAILQSVCKQLYSKVSIAESSAQAFGSGGTNDHTKLEFGNGLYLKGLVVEPKESKAR